MRAGIAFHAGIARDVIIDAWWTRLQLTPPSLAAHTITRPVAPNNERCSSACLCTDLNAHMRSVGHAGQANTGRQRGKEQAERRIGVSSAIEHAVITMRRSASSR